MAKRRRRRSGLVDVLAIVSRAREAAKEALSGLRVEIKRTRAMLEKLMESERSFRSELFGGAGPGSGRTPRAAQRARPRRKGPPKADRFFERLPKMFTLDDVRKVAGRLSGVSIAQWSRAKRVKKVGKEYQKTG